MKYKYTLAYSNVGDTVYGQHTKKGQYCSNFIYSGLSWVFRHFSYNQANIIL